MTGEVERRATDAVAHAEWTSLPKSMQDALRGARKCHGGATIHDHGVSGGVVAGLRSRRYLDAGFGLRPRALYLRSLEVAR